MGYHWKEHFEQNVKLYYLFILFGIDGLLPKSRLYNPR